MENGGLVSTQRLRSQGREDEWLYDPDSCVMVFIAPFGETVLKHHLPTLRCGGLEHSSCELSREMMTSFDEPLICKILSGLQPFKAMDSLDSLRFSVSEVSCVPWVYCQAWPH
ncbi:unnamed protein product [Leuciscus chuanchicus]